MVEPDKRKGLLYVHQTDDALMHLCWKERTKAVPEDDLIIFPDDFEYKVVPQCTTGRVYVLKFKSNNRKLFFWLQEPKTDKDEENCRKLNEYLNNPPAPGSNRSGGGGGGLGNIPGLPAEFAGLGADGDLQSLLSGMNQQQLVQLLGGMGGMSGLSSLMSGRSSANVTDSNPPSRVQSSPGVRALGSTTSVDSQASSQAPTPRPVTASGALQSQPSATIGRETGQSEAGAGGSQQGGAAAAASRIQLKDLQNILSSFGTAGASEPKEVDLSEGLNAELLIPILANAEVQQRLVPFLPQGESLPASEEELRQTVHSPQFHQAVQSFSAAFSSCQLGPLMAQFGLGDEAVAAANVGDMTAFAKALQEAAKKKKEDAEKETPTKMEEDK
jgi:hypothetical protein